MTMVSQINPFLKLSVRISNIFKIYMLMFTGYNSKSIHQEIKYLTYSIINFPVIRWNKVTCF